MSLPKVTITEVDGALGVLPAGAKYPAFVGDSTAGTADTPAGYGSVTGLTNALGNGAMPELAARFIATEGRPVVCVKTGETTAGAMGSVDSTGKTGTSVVTATAGSEPVDDFEVYVVVVVGGTVGTPGITYRTSLDDGRTISPVTALGAANTLAIAGRGVSFDLAAGTLVAGDVIRCRTTGPQPDATDLTTALTALRQSSLDYDCFIICNPIDGTLFDAIQTAEAAFAAAGKPIYWMAPFRIPTIGETEADYKTAFETAFSAKSTTYGAVTSGACEIISSIGGQAFQRPSLWPLATRQAAVDEEVNIAEINVGLLPGVTLTDSLGNPKHHDEYLDPGLDDSRSMVLRTWPDDPAGIYCNRPRLLSSETSDFQLIPHRRVMNLARRALAAYFRRRLSKPIRVDAATGYILENEAIEIENGAHNTVSAVLMAKPKASGGGFSGGRFVQLSRTDNLLSTKNLTVQARVVPLAYPEFVSIQLGFYNPSLQVVTA